ncbi:dead box ATP-dependent RNA helicase, putative [Ricinus communis]|uniref:Dead box ATP-dependent RNA helicase, putative n=2 Tax=Ricinus communis TaxID=3988 RepID=B9RHY9_RICCO|nr:dead box ATP-dependent RNA helicase, putative [Ricinus communis]|eukprot:XP_002513358.1 DEAD-box ATP-dependent RNA helicase 36 [Ricinus communis]
MEQEEIQVEKNFPLFFKPSKTHKPLQTIKPPKAPKTQNRKNDLETPKIEKEKSTNSITMDETSLFSNLGLAEWAVRTCKELGMKRPTPVQAHCIPKILEGKDVLGLAQTGSGKTATFALPILHRLAEDPYGIFALVITPTRELAYQLAEQFRALGSCLNLRCAVVVGGMDKLTQAKTLMARPHVVIATPGRVKVLLEDNPDIPSVFSKTKFLVLDEADRVLDVGFEDELRVVFQCLPKNRQTLLFSATMTSNLESLLEVSANKAYFYEAYEGFKTVDTLKQQYVLVPKNVKDVYLVYILSKMEDMGIRSAIIFVSTCRTCYLLSLLLEELEKEPAALHSFKSQSLRLSALRRFKSGQASILIATDVASRGLDIPTVDLVVNYDLPRYPRDYVHRVGRTARAGRGGLAMSFISQNDFVLIREIEAVLGKQLGEFECKENEVLSDITKIFKARHVATMKMLDDGFEEKEKERKKQKLKTMAEKGLLKKKKMFNNRKRKRQKSAE